MCVKCCKNNKALCCKRKEGVFELFLLADEGFQFCEHGIIFLVPRIIKKEILEYIPIFYEKKFIELSSIPLDKYGYPGLFLSWKIKLVFPDSKCGFLNENRCSIYRNRPFVCRMYPQTLEPGIKIKSACKECCEIDVTVTNGKKCIKTLFSSYKNRFKAHKKLFSEITDILYEEIGDIFFREIIINLMHKNRSVEPVNVPTTIYYVFNLCKLKKSLHIIDKQIDLLKKLGKVKPSDRQACESLIKEYSRLKEVLNGKGQV